MEILGIMLSLTGLMYFAYKGINVLVLAPLMALFACLWQSQAPLMATYTQIYMPALGSYLMKYFPLFLLGAIFGKLMAKSKAALAIGELIANKLGSKHAISAVVLSCALLTYGGVSLFVVAFCVYPIARQLFYQAKISKKIIPGSIALGSFTFTMTALPGTPAIQNAIPMPYFGTDAFAAPLYGLVGSLLMLIPGLWWLKYSANKAIFVAEESFEEDSENLGTPSPWVGLIPLILVVSLNYFFSRFFFPSLDLSFLAETKWGAITGSKLIGLWSLIVSMVISIAALMLLAKNYLHRPIKSINEGTMESLLPIFNTSSEVGYGAVIASFASFAKIKALVLGIFPNTPLISEALAINALAGITGSASGGLSIALEALATTYIRLGEAASISPELLHRVASMSCGGFDTLPHNGAVITLLSICGLTHKDSYKDIFMVAVLFPFIATAVVVLMGSIF